MASEAAKGMTKSAMDGVFWRDLCFSERFDPPFCRPLLAAGGRCRSHPDFGRVGIFKRATGPGLPAGRYHKVFWYLVLVSHSPGRELSGTLAGKKRETVVNVRFYRRFLALRKGMFSEAFFAGECLSETLFMTPILAS